MDRWMKWLWALAAMVVAACLMSLGHAGGGGASYGPAAAGHHGHSAAGPEYFTLRDPVRGTVEYGVHEGGSARIYASRLER
jgi:hypothetical protein